MVARIEMKFGTYHFSNSLKVAHMEIKLGTHYHDNYMLLTTTYCSNSFRHSSLLKLANGSTHGDETWYKIV